MQPQPAKPPSVKASSSDYEMVITRLTIDKLGVKLYDSVSAVVAELIANSYDADARDVRVSLPLNTELAHRVHGKVEDRGHQIQIVDDGHGMAPEEAIEHYLKVGKDRRAAGGSGAYSRELRRPVMGRKGIGKLAPFGICRSVEVLSSGGPKTEQGYLTTHFVMEYDSIVQASEEPARFAPGPLDRKYRPTHGTTIRLQDFQPKRVPNEETFHRQLARRFVFARPDFRVLVQDNSASSVHERVLDPMDIPVLESTKIDVSTRPVPGPEGESLPVRGWLALARNAYQNEEMAGVRIYARGKIVATTRDFERPAGFTGEFSMRSYLVGMVEAEWLDEDAGDDLIRTDRQGILWESDRGRALREWGARLIREIASISREPQRERKRQIFLERSSLEAVAKERFADLEVRTAALDLGKRIGGFAAEDELSDGTYVEDLREVILSLAPHKALIDAFAEFAKRTGAEGATIQSIAELFGKARVAEMASYAQLASERVRAITELEKIVDVEADEAQLQDLIARAPWLVEPTWTVISTNQGLKNFKREFEKYWKKEHHSEVVLAIGHETKRPDFTLVEIGGLLHIVEIKRAGHAFDDDDCLRLLNYAEAFDTFLDQNPEIKVHFPRGYMIDLVADSENVKQPNNRRALKELRDNQRLKRVTWAEFLSRTRKAHEALLDVRDRVEAIAGSRKK